MKKRNISADQVVIGVLVAVTLTVGTCLMSTRVKADSNAVVDQVTIQVPVSCTLSGTINSGNDHTATMVPGSYRENIGKTNLKASCNDFDGFAIYAIGYTGDTEGANTMVGANTGQTITTGTATSGGTSNWAMKLTKVLNPVSGDPITYNPQNLTITSGYEGYHAVPSTYTKVATYAASTGSSATDQVLGSNIETTYAAFMTSTQVADTYTGKVKYLLVHPSSINSISSTGVTAVFQAYPGSSISFSDGSSTNTVVFRQLCEDPNDTSTCSFAVTDGEYKNPVGYKGAWAVPLPDGQGGYSMHLYEVQNGADGWAAGLDGMGSAFLGQTIPVYAYNGNAVIYDGNGATGGEMTEVASRFEDNGGEEAILIAPNYYKTGYGFAGWSTSSSAAVNSGATIYGPNASVSKSSFSYDVNGNVTMYAVWVPSAGNLQSFTCSSLSSGAVTALTDTRDGNVYTVGKLADGNCWMMENLRLDGSATLNATNTNNPAISGLGASSNSWCDYGAAECIDQVKLNTNNTDSLLAPNYSWGSTQWYGYGNYYNWYAATAGNGTYALDSGSAAGDICPSGWHLPSGSSAGEFYALNTAVNSGATGSMAASAGLRAYPNNFVYSGSWDDSSAFGRSDSGYYWSRTAGSSSFADGLKLDGDSINPGTFSWDKYYGHSIRCVQSGS